MPAECDWYDDQIDERDMDDRGTVYRLLRMLRPANPHLGVPMNATELRELADDGVIPMKVREALRACAEREERALAGITDEVVDAALHARVPGGANVRDWLPQDSVGNPHETALTVMRCALQSAALALRPEARLRELFVELNTFVEEGWSVADLETVRQWRDDLSRATGDGNGR